MSSKFDGYEIQKTTKYFFSFNNLDGETGSTPSNFNILMNNPSFTQVQSYAKNTDLKFTPLSVIIDLKFFNVSGINALYNNRIQITSTMFANSPITVEIPNGYYSASSLASTLQTLLEANVRYVGNVSAGWLVDIQNAVNLRIRWTEPYGTPANTTINFVPTGFDSKSLLGFSNDSYVITYANRATGITGNLAVDLVPYESLRLCSNIAKRFWVKRNNILVQSDILLEIPLVSYELGGILKFETVDDLYEQDVHPDFNNILFQIKDENDNIIQFDPTAKINIMFILKRTISYPSPEEKIKAVQNYSSYSG